MASNNIARLGVVLGLDTAEFTAAIDKAVLQNRKMGRELEKDTQRAAGALADLTRETQDYGKVLTRVQMVERDIAEGRYGKVNESEKLKGLTQGLLAQAAAYDKIAVTSKGATINVGRLTAWQKQGLMYQTTDFFTQIASGQSILIAAIQQGGQLKDQMGGLGNMFKLLGSMITPTVVILASAAAVIGVVGLAAYKGNKEFKDYANSIALTGNYAGLSYDNFLKMADGISKVSTATIGGSKDILSALVASGKFTEKSLDTVALAVVRFSDASGLSAKQAAEQLIPSLNGSASSAYSLNQKYNFLTLAQYKYIESLALHGEKEKAATETARLFGESIENNKLELSSLGVVLNNISKWFVKFWDSALNIGRGEDLDSKLKRIRKEITETLSSLGKDEGSNKFKEKLANRYTELIKQEEELAKKIKERNEKRVADGEKGKIKGYVDSGSTRSMELQIEKNKLEEKLELTKVFLSKYEEIQATSLFKIREIELQYKYDIVGKDLEFSKVRAQLANQEIAKVKAKELADLADLEEKNAEAESKKLDAKLKSIELVNAAETARMNRLIQKEFDFYEKTKISSDLKKEDLKFQLANIGNSEKEIQLNKTKLEYEKEIARIKDNTAYRSSPETIDRLTKLAEEKRANADFNIGLQQQIKDTGEVFNSVWGEMSAALDKFVDGGKIKFADLTLSIIRNLIKISAKQNALKLWDLGKKFFRSDFGGIDGAGDTSGGFDTFADGGSPPVGKASLVGERGPELFVPRTAGTIIPNNALSGMGQPQNVFNGPYIANMNAIDTQSATQFLVQNKQTIWAANASASRSMPAGR
tara:strand:- start:3589 stop:6042 length:2454 start_codon:yes stop_codon:yes gene_type:complete